MDHILFGFNTMISLDAKTRSVPQFICASLCNFEIVDLGIKLLAPLALDGRVNPSGILVLSIESLHHPWPPYTEESPWCSKCISRSIF